MSNDITINIEETKPALIQVNEGNNVNVSFETNNVNVAINETVAPSINIETKEAASITVNPAGVKGDKGEKGTQGLPGLGDMIRSIYDINNNGIVDDAERLGGVMANFYADKSFVQSTSLNGGYF